TGASPPWPTLFHDFATRSSMCKRVLIRHFDSSLAVAAALVIKHPRPVFHSSPFREVTYAAQSVLPVSSLLRRLGRRRRTQERADPDRQTRGLYHPGEPQLFSLPGRGQAPPARFERRRPRAVLDARLLRRGRHPYAVLPEPLSGHQRHLWRVCLR